MSYRVEISNGKHQIEKLQDAILDGKDDGGLVFEE